MEEVNKEIIIEGDDGVTLFISRVSSFAAELHHHPANECKRKMSFGFPR